ncbi:hypothetical protein CRE_03428 [Caenorhabditis remanei]|uniref:Uncharacterized protein n=1 Tax=Caenorhabditis remanei TaxID=31234 RepID=E3NAN6_CAERE|nr:hypothetical protein CRE_03428 [Caenorhabditis remanei]
MEYTVLHRRIESSRLPHEASEAILGHPRFPLAKPIAHKTYDINGQIPEREGQIRSAIVKCRGKSYSLSGDTDDDSDIIEKRLGNADTFQDPQRVLPAEAADDDILELPAVRVRKYLSRKAKELPINYVHHADSQETAGTLPPGMLSTISPKTKLSTTERLNDEPHMVFPAKLGSSSPY